MTGQLQISVLGPVRAWSHGRALPLGTPRQRTVFAVLVAAANRIVTHQELIAAVWGAAPPATAKDNLYTYVSGLRRSLGDVLESQPAGYRLRIGAQVRDSDRFAQICAEAVVLQESGTAGAAAARFGDALQLWHGEAYAGLEGHLLEVERAHLARQRLDAIERRLRLRLQQGDDDTLVAELAGLIRDHPLHEPLHELLMAALHQAGRSAEALEVYRAARQILVAELGVEPGPALRARHREILQSVLPEPGRDVGAAWEDLSDRTQDLLSLAVLLGAQFRVEVLIAAAARPAFDVLAGLDEALAAGVLLDAGAELAFCPSRLAHLVRDSIPAAVRAERHRRLAEVLAGLGRPAAEVAGQLTAQSLAADTWILSWFAGQHAEVTEQAPELAARLARLLLQSALPTPRQRETLLVAYTKADFRAGGRPHRAARQALEAGSDPADRAELRQILATLQFRDGDLATATALLDSALADPRTPPIWRTRHRVLRSHVAQISRPDQRPSDPVEAASALQTGWRTQSIQRDHERALQYADDALHLLGPRTPHVEMYLDLLDNRIFSLQNLDRLDEAQRSLHDAAVFGARHRLADPLALASAVQHFWTGRWSEAVAQISTLTDDAPDVGLLGMREQRAGVLLLHGVAALIAVHRDDLDQASAHLHAAAAGTEAERENDDFLLVARALIAEQQHRLPDCLDTLAPLLEPGYAPMVLRHQWLPDLLRVARQADRGDLAERALDRCAAEAAKERTPARAGAALARCQALLSGDPGPALSAAEHYRAVGRVPELAAALEDAAVLLAARGHADDATRHEHEAAALYDTLGARGDLRRLRSRIAPALSRS